MIHTLPPNGGSGVGLSYYEKLLTCPRKARLERERSEAGAYGVMSLGLATGFLTHAFMDLYENNLLPREAPASSVSFEPHDHSALLSPGALDEAVRLISWWKLIHPPHFFGETLGMEIHMEAPPSLCTELGIPGLTGRADQVVRIDEVTAARLNRDRLLNVSPGLYIIDLKCLKSRMFNKYLLGLQATAYQLLWNSLHPEEPCDGFIFHFLIKTKVPDSICRQIFPPIPEDIAILKNAFKVALAWREALGEDQPNPFSCAQEYDTVCEWFENGTCDRT